MTVAAYIRVSTRRQNDDGQRAEVQKWLDANGIDPKKVEWYADKENRQPASIISSAATSRR